MSPAHLKLSLRTAAHLGLISVLLTAASMVFDTTVRASSYSSEISQLQAQESALQNQLSSLQGRASQDSGAAARTQQQITATEGQLTVAQGQLSRADAALAETGDRLAVARAQMARDRGQLAALVTQLYQQDPTGNSFATDLANSSGVNQLLDSTLSLQNLRGQFSQLTQQVHQDALALKSLQVRQRHQQLLVANDVSSLQLRTSQLQSEKATFTAEAASLTGQAAQTAAQVQDVSQRIQSDQAAEQAAELAAEYSYTGTPGSAGSEEGTILAICALGSSDPACPTGPYYNDFPYGQCTWYVATHMSVSWSGNADQWYEDAAAAGASVGQTLRAGAAVVFSAGGAYDPYDGHVAWVVQVLGPQTFIVDEANFLSGEQDEREISTLSGVVGFIYS